MIRLRTGKKEGATRKLAYRNMDQPGGVCAVVVQHKHEKQEKKDKLKCMIIEQFS